MSAPTIDELGPPDEDTMRILVSTDNHLGYMERDPARGLDSFAALEEVLYLAKKYKVRVRLDWTWRQSVGRSIKSVSAMLPMYQCTVKYILYPISYILHGIEFEPCFFSLNPLSRPFSML